MHDTFFFTDLHGQKDLFHAMYNWCLRQDPECTIIYGGDAADRGEHGYEIIKELLTLPQVVYIYGNHEDLFIKAADELLGQYAANDELYHKIHHIDSVEKATNIIRDAHGWNIALHLQNGGFPTLRDWLLDGANEDIIDQLRELPRTVSSEVVDFCHAGSTYMNFSTVNKAEYYGKPLDYYAAKACIWDRDCLALGWETGRTCVFGHTPTILLSAGLYGSRDKSERNAHPAAWQDHMGAKDKRGGWKIDMDTGATWTGRAYVLNVLTMQVTGFYDPHVPFGADFDGELQEEFENYKII